MSSRFSEGQSTEATKSEATADEEAMLSGPPSSVNQNSARSATVNQLTAVVPPFPNSGPAESAVSSTAPGSDFREATAVISSEEEFVMASSDMFADPSALDFLQNAGGSVQIDSLSELERQSLYVNFDPLVSKRRHEAAASISEVAAVAEQKQ